jgi:hypothetical protein
MLAHHDPQDAERDRQRSPKTRAKPWVGHCRADEQREMDQAAHEVVRRRHTRFRLEEAVVEYVPRDNADRSDGDLGLCLRSGDALPETMSVGDVIGREAHVVRVVTRRQAQRGRHVVGGSGYWPNLALAVEPR